MATRQEILVGDFGPIYMNEDVTKQAILAALYLNETASAGGGGGGGSNAAMTYIIAT